MNMMMSRNLLDRAGLTQIAHHRALVGVDSTPRD
jgi:hypothetical protein